MLFRLLVFSERFRARNMANEVPSQSMRQCPEIVGEFCEQSLKSTTHLSRPAAGRKFWMI